MSPVSVAINGSAGRMGKALISCTASDPELKLVAALESPNCPALGKDSGIHAGIESTEIAISSDLPEDENPVVVDFSSVQGALAAMKRCVERKLPLVLATTGFEQEELQKIEEAAKDIPVLFAPNMSPAVNLGMHLTSVASKALKNLGADVDVEILERHHRMKKDSPSGTALKFGSLVSQGLHYDKVTHGREGMVGEKPVDEIGYHAIRTGSDAGQHTIVFGMPGETIEITVASSNRDGYAKGALAAAKFLVGKPAGLYSMNDLLAF